MENSFLSEMGKRIKQLRTHLRMSQEELAEKVDISKQTISMTESGNQELRAGNIVKIAGALGVSTDYLLKGTRTDADNMKLDKRIRSLNNDQYDYISDVINKFVDLCEKTNDIK